VMKVYLLAIP